MRPTTTRQRLALMALFSALGAGAAQAHDGHDEPMGVWHNLAHAVGGPDHLQALLVLGALLVSVLAAGLIVRRVLKRKDRL